MGNKCGTQKMFQYSENVIKDIFSIEILSLTKKFKFSREKLY